MHTHELWKAQLLDREPKAKSTRQSRAMDYLIGALMASGLGLLFLACMRYAIDIAIRLGW